MYFSPSKLKTFLQTKNIAPKRSLGQNFLIDRNIVNKIINAAQLSKQDLVIEVGAGLGVLTAPLAHSARKVIAYEIDERLAAILRDMTSEYKNVEIAAEDVLKNVKCQPCKLAGSNIKFYKVVGNLPYYITSRIIRYFLSLRHKPQSMIITVQKEVAERICATPPQMSLLSISVQFFGRPQIIAQVSKNCFWPRPKVDSAIVRIDCNGSAYLADDEHQFFTIVKAGFSSKRKMLIGNLRQKFGGERRQWEEIFGQIGLNSRARAQELSIEQWRLLSSKFKTQSSKPQLKI